MRGKGIMIKHIQIPSRKKMSGVKQKDKSHFITIIFV